MKKESDAGDAVSANFLGLHAIFCTILSCFCNFLRNFVHLFLMQFFQTQSCVSAIFQTFCNSVHSMCKSKYALITVSLSHSNLDTTVGVTWAEETGLRRDSRRAARWGSILGRGQVGSR